MKKKKKKPNKRNEIETVKQAKEQSENETINAGDVVSLSGEKQSKDSKNGSWSTPAEGFCFCHFFLLSKKWGSSIKTTMR